MRLTLIGLVAWLAGCYSSRGVDCAVRCGAGAQPCANGFHCDDPSGLCVSADFAGTCGGGDGGGEPASACATEHMIVMLDPQTALPAGWRCVSCATGDPLFERFVVGSDKFGPQGGTISHAHTFATPAVSIAIDAMSTVLGNGGNGRITDGKHPAGAPTLTTTADHVPQYRNVELIEPLAPVTELPKGAIIMLDSQILPSDDYVAYASQVGLFVRAAGSLGTGGAPTHSHMFNTTLPQTGESGAAFGAGSIPAAIAHSHALTGTLGAVSNDPAHVVIVLAEVTAATPLPAGAIAFFEVTPPEPWTVLSNPGGPLSGQFLKAGLAPDFAAHGSSTHDPGMVTFPSGTPSASGQFAAGGLVAQSDTHTHGVAIRFSVEDTRPPYTEVIIAKLGPTGCP